MTTLTPSRLGQDNLAGDAKANFLKVYGGEVLTSFNETNVFKDKHIVRSIPNGKSASFPVMGKKEAKYHTVGTELTGTAMAHSEKVITVDDLLVADSVIADIDAAMNHYDVRSEYTKQDGAALARAYDKNVAAVGLNAARSSATITGGNGGTVIEGATFLTTAADLVAALFDMAQAFDEKDVPMEDRFAFFKPAQAYLMAEYDRVSNRNSEQVGDFSKGSVGKIAGWDIIKTNNLPQSNVTTGFKADYNGNFSTTAGLCLQRSAIGTVMLRDLAVETERSARHQADFMISKYLLGHGILRPEAAGELRTGTPT